MSAKEKAAQSAAFAKRRISNRLLAPLDLGDLVGLGAAGRHDLDGGALLLADQCARERRGDRDLAFLGIGFHLAHDLPHLLLLGVFVDQCHRRAELDGVARELRDVDDVGARELVLKLGYAAFVVRLLFLRGVIFRVLGQVAMRARLGDVLNDARTLHRLPLLQFVRQRSMADRSHRNLFNHLSSFNRAGGNGRPARNLFQIRLSRLDSKPASPLISDPQRGSARHSCEAVSSSQAGSTTNHFAGVTARSTISFRKSNSGGCGPQGPRPDTPGCPGPPPPHPKEWCNTALYARGQRASMSGCRPAPAVPRWY